MPVPAERRQEADAAHRETQHKNRFCKETHLLSVDRFFECSSSQTAPIDVFELLDPTLEFIRHCYGNGA
jgi:hypothetical protein